VPLYPPTKEDVPDAIFGLFHIVVKFDHLHQLMTVTYNCILDKLQPLGEQYHEGKRKLESIFIQLGKSPSTENTFHCDSSSVEHGSDREAFCLSVRRAKDIFTTAIFFRSFFPPCAAAVLWRSFSRLPCASHHQSFSLSLLSRFQIGKLIGSSPEVLVRVQTTLHQ